MQTIKNHLTLSASILKGTPVRNAADEKVGEIEDIMLDTVSGRVAYVVLSVDTGLLNIDIKYFAIPWASFHFDTTQEEVIILNIDKEKLKNSQDFDKDNCLTSPQFNFIKEETSYILYNPVM